MKRICISLMLLLCCVMAAVAVPAKPGWHTVNQSDGTTLQVQAVGNAFNHALLTKDGLMVALGDDGDFYYRSSLTGLTTVRAHEAKDRTATETAFIAAQRSHLTMQPKEFRPVQGKPAFGVGGSNADSDVPAQGTRKVPIILVEFKDKKFKNTREQIISAMLTGNTSVGQYFRDQSNGKYDPDFEVFGIYTLSQNRSSYGGNDSGGNDKGLGTMVTEACQMAAAAGVSFSPYDTNNDNYCDVVIVIYAGVGEAQASYTVPSAIWPCNWNLQSAAYYGLGGNGAFRPNGSGPYVNNFAVFNEVHGSNDNGSTIDGIGTFCHEFGHCLGLPDYYDTNYGGHYGMGYWDIMDTGCYANDTYTPVGYSAYEKNFMGWIDYVIPNPGTYYTLPIWNQKNEETDKALFLQSNINGNEFFIIENRRLQGWDRYLPAQGLLIHHITYSASRWQANNVNNQNIQLITIMPADNSLSTNNETGDTWPRTNKTEFTDNSTPAAKLNMAANGNISGNAGYLGKPVTEMVINGDGTASFWYMKGSAPTPELAVNPTSLSFTTNVGQSVTKTFTVTGTNLTGNVNVAVSGSNYSVTPTIITPAQAAAGATVTVTYNPSAAGNHTGTVTLTSGGAQNVTVSLTGTATTVPTINVNPAALTFNTTVGTPVTQTINVQGSNLSGTVYVTVSGTGFTVDKSNITRSQANNGTTVTVTYNPTATGNHTGTVTFTSSGAETQTVTLNGTAVGVPTITASPTSLTFNTTVGTPVTQTINVQGSNLSGTVYVSVSGTGFTVDKTSITRTQATNGTTVTVTYNPTAAGNHTGTVTFTSSGAETQTVTLNGTAVGVPTITASPTSLTFNTTVGTPVTQTINVQGSNLSGTVYVSVSGTGFTIDKTSITRTQATNGTTVTVTYNPTAVGNHTGTVTFTSSGAETQTVTLNGTAVGIPTITATPTSLTFNTTVGDPVTQTFTVTGTDLTGNISLAVQGTGFTIDKTSITRNQATNGTTVTVTYNPTAGGNHTGTVTLTSAGAQNVTVSLNGTATTIPALTVNPATLNMVTTVGTPVTQTFTVTGANLTGNVSLAVQGAGFTIDKTDIPSNQATTGSTVTVTYNPTAFGIHTGTVTITSAGAQPVTVTLNGQADLVKFAPVMLPAIEEYIDLTQFRADWTDETPAQNVASYTLEVNPKPVAPPAELIASLSGTQFSGQQYYAVTLTYPWAGTNTRGHNNEIIYFRNNYDGDGSYGNITYTIPAGYENATFTMKITSGTNTTEAVGNLTVATPQTAGVTHYFNPSETYAWVVTASSGDKITITTPDAQYSPDIALIEVYSGDATTTTQATEPSDADYRLITGITDRFYTVENLTAEGTFLYRVKALYLDGTESDWSNVEEVTLFQQIHGFDVGDVNHDGLINIEDVTDLIDALLDSNTVCEICADVKADGVINIADVTTLIDIMLESPSKSIKSRTPAGFQRPGDRLNLKF